MSPVPAIPTVLMRDIRSTLPGLELQDVARLVWRSDLAAEQLDDLGRSLGKRAIGGIDALFEVEVVLKPHPDMAAQNDRLRHHGKLVAADAEGRPDSIPGQLAYLIGHCLRVARRSPGNAEAQLEERRIVDESFRQQLLCKPQIAR